MREQEPWLHNAMKLINSYSLSCMKPRGSPAKECMYHVLIFTHEGHNHPPVPPVAPSYTKSSASVLVEAVWGTCAPYGCTSPEAMPVWPRVCGWLAAPCVCVLIFMSLPHSWSKQ